MIHGRHSSRSVDDIFSDGELWQYGRYNFERLGAAAGVCSTVHRRVSWSTSMRRGMSSVPAGRCRGPMPATSQPYYGVRSSAATPSPSELWSGDPFGRDKANVGPTTQPQ